MPESHPLAVVISCEHGGNHVPPEYALLFAKHAALLDSHRGCDAGALYMARHLSRMLHVPLHASETTRLLVDLTRSPDTPTLFSEITRKLPANVRTEILEKHYRPYRDEVENAVATAIREGSRVLHISSHSFTPVLDGKVRETEIGLLYDPDRRPERSICDAWLEETDRVPAHAACGRRLRGDRAGNQPETGRRNGLDAFLPGSGRRPHTSDKPLRPVFHNVIPDFLPPARLTH